MKHKKYDAVTLTHFFVKRSLDTKIPITAHKVEFMVYFAHGWHMAIDGRGLFSEKVKAWKHGPTIESVHKFYKNVKDIRDLLDVSAVETITEDDRSFLEGIWLYYSHLNEVEMQSLCLDEGTPWHTIYEKSSKELVLDDKIIEQHYRLLHLSNPEFCDLDDPFSVD